MGDWTFRSQDVSFPGTKHRFWTFRSVDVSFLGWFVPWSFRSSDVSFPYSSQVPVCKRRPGRLSWELLFSQMLLK